MNFQQNNYLQKLEFLLTYHRHLNHQNWQEIKKNYVSGNFMILAMYKRKAFVVYLIVLQQKRFENVVRKMSAILQQIHNTNCVHNSWNGLYVIYHR